jgi:hypothetical protein
MTVEFAIQVCGWLVGVPLEFLLVAALLRGEYRRFPFVFAYASANLVTTLVEIPADVDHMLHPQDPEIYKHFAHIYWVNEVILWAFILAVVISLIDQAASRMRSRHLVRAGLVVGALLFAGISFALHYRTSMKFFGYWMTPWTRDLNFGSAILDLGLWTMLIASRRDDSRLLIISGALGMRFAGEAIGYAISKLSIAQKIDSVNLAGSIITMLADLACLYVWWRTFQPSPVTRRPPQDH